MSNNAVTTQERKAAFATVGAALEKMKPQFAAVLPKHITPERMMRVAMVAIQNTPKLLDCDRTSLYLAVSRAASLGLEPDGILGQAYLVPYGKQVQFIPGYKGLIDLARRSGDVSNLIAKEVCANDDFEILWHQSPPFRHKQEAKGDRGEVIGFWALANFKDGGFHWDYLPVDEVLRIRDQSSGWQSAKKWNKTAESPWEKHFVEMGKKTAIRRIAKYLPMSVQKAAMFDTLQDAGHKVSFDGDDLVIDEPAEQGQIIDGEAAPATEPKALDKFSESQTAAGDPVPPGPGETEQEIPNAGTSHHGAPTTGDPAPSEEIPTMFRKNRGAA